MEDLLRELTPQVLAAVVRRYGDFAAGEDAVQEALLAASRQWPKEGLPAHPKGWLITAAARRRIEMLRSDEARRHREDLVVALEVPGEVTQHDDSLALLLLCCHPALAVPSQVALTLRAVGGLTTAEIARALLIPETTVGQRISRAKSRLRGERFTLPPVDEQEGRVAAVLAVLYLIFNEGYTASSGTSLTRVELSAEAIRLARRLYADRPDDAEVAGLLALLLLTDARRAARTDARGALVPLAEQDRSRWDAAMIAEGVALISATLQRRPPLGPYQLQAAIAAVHDEAPDAAGTDWAEIHGLYALLERVAPGPMVTLNRLVAVAMVDGPRAALAELDGVALGEHHRAVAVRAHLLEMAGEPVAAHEHYIRAARLTRSVPEKEYLTGRAARLAP